MKRTPPDILITTPESLYLMITSQVREILTGVEAVIVDEIHAVAQSKRGSHLALTLERLSHLATARGQARSRSGSGSRRPSARSSASPSSWSARKRECEIVNAGVRKELDLEIVVPVDDMTEPASAVPAALGDGQATAGGVAGPHRPGPDRVLARPGSQPALDLAGDLPRAAAPRPRAHLDDHLRQQPPRRRTPRQAPQRAPQREPDTRSSRRPSTTGSRRGPPAPRTAIVLRGDRASPPRLARPRGAARRRGAPEVRASCPASSPPRSLELGIDMGALDLVIQVESPKSVSRGPAAGRPRRPPAQRGLEGPDLPQVPRRPARVRGRRQADARRARSRRR